MTKTPAATDNDELTQAIRAAVDAAAQRWPEQMRPATLAAYFDTTKATIYRKFLADPTFPRPVKHGSRITLFSKTEIDRWLEAQRRSE
jgi:predicted DNA-binding transcriptional regulator AlpA